VVQRYMSYSNLKKTADIVCSRSVKFLTWLWFVLKYKILIPFAKFTITFLSTRLNNETLTLTHCEWKETVLADFGTWLADLPDTQPDQEGITPDSCDLYTLLSEFSALRQEIKIQNREQNKSIKTVETIISSYDKSREVIMDMTDELIDFKEKTLLTLKEKEMIISQALEKGDEKVRTAAEKRTIIPFLDIRDALIRGLTAGEKLSKSKSYFRPVPRGIEGITEGYEMAVRRFDRALEQVGVYPVNAKGKPFDPKIMRAVDQRPVHETQKGIVLEEQLSGFICGEEVIRTAEVVVGG